MARGLRYLVGGEALRSGSVSSGGDGAASTAAAVDSARVWILEGTHREGPNGRARKFRLRKHAELLVAIVSGSRCCT